MIDIETSEIDQDEKNEGDIDFLKQFKERHKKKKFDEESGSDSDSSGTINSNEYLKQIDEVDEEELRRTLLMGELNKKKTGKSISEFNVYEDKPSNEEEKEKGKKNENSISKKTTEVKNDAQPFNNRTSIVDQVNLLRKIDPDEEIVKTIEEKLKTLENLNNFMVNKINSKEDEEATEGQTDEISSLSNNFNPIQDLKLTIDEIPLKFQDTYMEVEEKMKNYVKDLDNHFYKETFELFSAELKELYDKKYNKYIEVNNYYHNNITEKEYQLENDSKISEEKKAEIQQVIDSLKEEQKDQIDKITDEYNELIDSKITEFKQTFFKKDVGIYLMEEQLKLDIYTLINEAFY